MNFAGKSLPLHLKILLGVTILLAFFTLADAALAQGLIPCNGIDCQACHIASLIQNVIRFLILVSIPLAAIMFAYAGFIYFTSGGSHDRLDKAKTIFLDVLIGFVIALAAFLIVETILRVVMDKEYRGDWNKIQCVSQEERNKTIFGEILKVSDPVIQSQLYTPEGSPIGTRCGEYNGLGQCISWGPEGRVGATVTTENGEVRTPEYIRQQSSACIESGECYTTAQAAEELRESGVGYCAGTVCGPTANLQENCGQSRGCTSFYGIDRNVVGMVIDYKDECNCSINVTAGTEQDGHATVYGPGQHIYGDKVDLAYTPDLVAWFKTQVNQGDFAYAGETKVGSRYCDIAKGNVWIVEKDHFDVRNGGCQAK